MTVQTKKECRERKIMLLAKTSDKVFNGFKVVQNVDINTNKKTGEDKYFFTILLMKGREIVCCNDSELITKEQAMKLIHIQRN